MRSVAAALFATSVVAQKEDLPLLWSRFKQQFGRAYNGDDEEQARFQQFSDNVALISAENAKGLPYTLGIGPFADISNAEFKENYLGYNQPDDDDAIVLGYHQWQGEALADSVDWTTQGVVTAVKDQGQCGSCWAFSTTGSLEGSAALATGQLESLAEQQLVDCAGFPNLGCMGGQMAHSLSWSKTHDFCKESAYPYRASGGKCQSSGCAVGLASGSVTGVMKLKGLFGPAKEADMLSAVSQQPVSVALEADKDAFQHYSSGVLTDATGCGSKPDHGVLVVGYGTDNGVDYWKVKNSWASTWGDGGYLKIARGGKGSGVCAILSGPVYPVVSASVAV